MTAEVFDFQDVSMNSMCGVPMGIDHANPSSPRQCRTMACLLCALSKVFEGFPKDDWPARKAAIFQVLKNTTLPMNELVKYTCVDAQLPYTRNLVATDGVNYTLILMCWNAGTESKIHDHPCDGCFVKTVKGSIKETRYAMHPENNTVVQIAQGCTSEGDVTYMDDSIGLHKVGAASDTECALTLHLYTPPYSKCRVSLFNSVFCVLICLFSPCFFSSFRFGQI